MDWKAGVFSRQGRRPRYDPVGLEICEEHRFWGTKTFGAKVQNPAPDFVLPCCDAAPGTRKSNFSSQEALLVSKLGSAGKVSSSDLPSVFTFKGQDSEHLQWTPWHGGFIHPFHQLLVGFPLHG